ncbi:MAG: AraC family transcriptional regulator [Planctomycetota bacterium]
MPGPAETDHPVPLAATQPVLWGVAFAGLQRARAGSVYFFDNNRRRPDGIWIVQSTRTGRIQIEHQGATHPATPGSIMLFRYGEPSAYGHPDPLPADYENQWVGLRGAGLDDHLRQLRDAAGPVLHPGANHPLHRDLAELQRLAEPGRAPSATHTAARTHAFVIALIDFVDSTRHHAQSAVERAVDHLLRHALEPLDTQSIAHRFGVSREHLTRVFRQRTGQTPARFLDRQRVDHALALLRATDLPLEDIARQAGLRSPRHLADRLRAATGRTPTQVRQHAAPR